MSPDDAKLGWNWTFWKRVLRPVMDEIGNKSPLAPGFEDGPGIRTDHSVLLGFGAESVTGAGNRTQVLRDALTYLGAAG